MKLHNNKELLQDAILATAEYLEMREVYVEKDYWVTIALYEIFNSDIASQVVRYSQPGSFQGWHSAFKMS